MAVGVTMFTTGADPQRRDGFVWLVEVAVFTPELIPKHVTSVCFVWLVGVAVFTPELIPKHVTAELVTVALQRCTHPFPLGFNF